MFAIHLEITNSVVCAIGGYVKNIIPLRYCGLNYNATPDIFLCFALFSY